MFDNVIVGVDDYGAGLDAVALATELVSHDAQIALVYVEEVWAKPAPDSGAVREARVQRFVLERLGALRDEAGVVAGVACVQAQSVRAGLHELASSTDADLIVIGASRLDDVTRMVLGDDTRAVLKNAPCAVAVAPAEFSAHPGRMRTIGVAYDGSPESERALALARKLAARRGATVSAFEAVEPPLYTRDPWKVDEEIEGDVEARRRIAALGGVEPHAEFVGDAVEGLKRYGASVDLLVLGSHLYGPVDHLLEGSTSQRLADDASCPLLVLPPQSGAAAHAAE